jgi:hypothetical protein
MNNNTMTVKMWDEITEIQAETLNGGTGGGNGSGGGKFNFNGPVGNVQINEGDGVQINPAPIYQQTYKYGYGRRYHH